MVKKQYAKSTGRMFLKHFVRLLSIAAIFLVTVSLVSGLGDVETNIYRSIDASYQEDNIHDFVIRSTEKGDNEEMFAIKDRLTEFKDKLNIKDVEEYYTLDIPHQGKKNRSRRHIFFDEGKNTVDRLEVLEGRLPKGLGEVAVERATKDFNNRHIGDVIDFPDYGSLTVVGVVKDPTMVALSKEPSDYFTEESPNYLNDVFYFDGSVYEYALVPMSLRITLKNHNQLSAFNGDYEDVINIAKGQIDFAIKDIVSDDHFVLLTLYLFFLIYNRAIYKIYQKAKNEVFG